MINERYYQLDSLRGVAAIFVVFYHIYLIIENIIPSTLKKVILYTPLRILITGNESVIFFFVLSGFVLSLPFLSNKQQQYFPYLVKRFLRIWLPYAVAITIAIIAKTIMYKQSIDSLSTWFNRQWASPVSFELILNHYLLIGTYDVYAFDVVLWSLIHEMRISIIFPVLMFFIIKYNWKVNLAIGICFTIIGGLAHLIYNHPFQPVYKSSLYLLMFISGALIAKNLPTFFSYYNRLGSSTRITIFFLGVLLYCYSYILKNPLLTDYITLVASSLILIYAIVSLRFSKLLLLKIFKFFGNISYSMYLYHVIVLLASIHFLHGFLPIGLILVIALLTTLIVSWLAWKYIELPSIAIGKFISSRLTRTKNKNVEKLFDFVSHD